MIVVGVVVLVSAPSGPGSVLVGLGVVALVTGIWAVLVGHAWVGPVGRVGGVVVAVGAVVLIGIGGVLTDSLEQTTDPGSRAQTAAPEDTKAPVPVEASAGGGTRTATSSPEPELPPPSEPSVPAGPTATTTSTPSGADVGTALGTVALLEVKGRAPKTGYDRDLFAYREVDLDRNGCDTRNDILNRDLTGITHRPGTGGCTVESGTLADPYSGTSIPFRRGAATSNDVQIDHVVALSDAWQKGAQQWASSTLQQFGNDPLNLLAVSGPLNSQKGDGDTATWLPPNKAYRCPYVARQVAVKHHYGLWVTPAERDAIVRVLSTCPDEPLPSATQPPPRVETSAPTPTATTPANPPATPAPTSAPPPSTPPPTSTDVYFKNCTAAREAGAAPVHIGDPGYGTHLDRDRDGIGCE